MNEKDIKSEKTKNKKTEKVDNTFENIQKNIESIVDNTKFVVNPIKPNSKLNKEDYESKDPMSKKFIIPVIPRIGKGNAPVATLVDFNPEENIYTLNKSNTQIRDTIAKNLNDIVNSYKPDNMEGKIPTLLNTNSLIGWTIERIIFIYDKLFKKDKNYTKNKDLYISILWDKLIEPLKRINNVIGVIIEKINKLKALEEKKGSIVEPIRFKLVWEEIDDEEGIRLVRGGTIEDEEERILKKKTKDESNNLKKVSTKKEFVRSYIDKNKFNIDNNKHLSKINKLLKLSTIKWEDFVKYSILYSYEVYYDGIKMDEALYSKNKNKYISFIEEFKNIRSRGVLTKEERKAKRIELYTTYKKEDYEFLEHTGDSGMMFELSICGKDNPIAKKLFNLSSPNIQQTDYILQTLFNSIKGKGSDESSNASKACFDLIDIDNKIIFECKDYRVNYIQQYEVNLSLSKVIHDIYEKSLEDGEDSFLFKRNSTDFKKIFYSKNNYMSFDLTINKFQDLQPIINAYTNSTEADRKIMDSKYFSVNSFEVWKKVKANQGRQLYEPLINKNRKIYGMVKTGGVKNTTDKMNELLVKYFQGKELSYCLYISIDLGNENIGTGIYDFTNDDLLDNEYILSRYPATLNKNGELQMVRIPVDRILPPSFNFLN